jgi:hypothetical protein
MLHYNYSFTAQHSASYEKNTILSLMHSVTLTGETSVSKIRFENVGKNKYFV